MPHALLSAGVSNMLLLFLKESGDTLSGFGFLFALLGLIAGVVSIGGLLIILIFKQKMSKVVLYVLAGSVVVFLIGVGLCSLTTVNFH